MPVRERNGGIVKESSFSRVEVIKKKKTQLMSVGERNGGDCE